MKKNVHQELQRTFPGGVIKSWAGVAKLLELCSSEGRNWLFRGVTDSTYKLVPKIGRDDRKPKMRPSGAVRFKYTREDELAALTFFRNRAKAFVVDTSRTDLEWIALAQHHGAPTRLLDWSEGLLVAMWFAARNFSFDLSLGKDGALWVAWDLPPVSEAAHTKPLSVRSVGIYRPDHFDRRISAQSSVFTLQQAPTEELKHANLFKLVIPHDSKYQIRKRLDAAGVNERTLFPDLAGLGEDVAWRYTNNFLQHYRPPAE